MTANLKSIAIVLGLGLLTTPASAHAFLDHATPGVGATVSASPTELDLSFTQDIEAPLATVRVTSIDGAVVATSKPAKDSSDGSVLHVRLSRPLSAGTYIVSWHVVSVDTHPTSGSYKFSIAK